MTTARCWWWGGRCRWAGGTSDSGPLSPLTRARVWPGTWPWRPSKTLLAPLIMQSSVFQANPMHRFPPSAQCAAHPCSGCGPCQSLVRRITQRFMEELLHAAAEQYSTTTHIYRSAEPWNKAVIFCTFAHFVWAFRGTLMPCLRVARMWVILLRLRRVLITDQGWERRESSQWEGGGGL